MGPFKASVNGRAANGFATRKARALLAYLAIEADRSHSRQKLASLLWPDSPHHLALTSLRQSLYRVNHALENGPDAPHLLIDREEIQFDSTRPHWLDTAELSSAVARCRRHHHWEQPLCPDCCRLLSAAADLYRGEFLDGISLPGSEGFSRWLAVEQAAYHQLALKAFDWLGFSREKAHQFGEASRHAQQEIALEPCSESAHRRRMRCLALMGNDGAAVHQFFTCRQLLGDELGMEPSRETVALFEQIRGGAARG